MGNKISIKDRFEAFVVIKDKNDALTHLKELLAEQMPDDDVKFGILPQLVRKFITENFEIFSVTIIEVSFLSLPISCLLVYKSCLFDRQLS